MAEPGHRAPIEARLGTFDTAMVVVSLVIGIGIFRTPAIVAQQAGSEALFHAAWILGGLIGVVISIPLFLLPFILIRKKKEIK